MLDIQNAQMSLVDRRINMALWQNCLCILLPGPCEWELPLIIFLSGIEKNAFGRSVSMATLYKPRAVQICSTNSVMSGMAGVCGGLPGRVCGNLLSSVTTPWFLEGPAWKTKQRGEDRGACVLEILTCGANLSFPWDAILLFIYSLGWQWRKGVAGEASSYTGYAK